MRSIDVIYRGSGDQRQVVWSIAKTGEAEGQKNLPQKNTAFSSNPVPTSAPRAPLLFQLGGTPELNALIAEAGPLAFPGAKTIELAQLSDAPVAGDTLAGGALLVLCDPDHATFESSQSQLDETGLARWAVVILRSAPPADQADPTDLISLSQCHAPFVARIFRSAWERHQLQRDNAQLRGDLMTFGTRIAHDLRTPLGGVLTTTEMLREVLAEDAPENVDLTQPILDSTDGLVKLIERASFFARARASRDPSRLLDMSAPFWSAFQHLERLLIAGQVSFTYPSAWPTVEGHENWLEVVWRILLTNALQHGVAGTKLEAGWSPEPDGQRFWVRNEGAVPPEKRAMLFFPFNRLYEPCAPRGLGLAMMRRLVEMDGGRCGFAMPPSGGVEFFFVLPVPADPKSAESQNTASQHT